jgi:hypothetical protein
MNSTRDIDIEASNVHLRVFDTIHKTKVNGKMRSIILKKSNTEFSTLNNETASFRAFTPPN